MPRILVLLSWPIWMLMAITPQASGQELLGLDAGGGVHHINLRSGLTTQIGSTGLTQELWTGLARDSGGRLFASYGYYNAPFAIYELNPATGQATFVLQTPFIGVSSMAFGPGDVLYLMDDASAPFAHGPYELHIVNLQTGSTTLVGSTGRNQLIALDFDDSGRLWAFAEDGLVEIDTATGAATDVNPTFEGPPDPTKSMVFGEDDTLWMIDIGVWIGDRTTGVPSLVAPMSIFSIFSGVEYVPGPTPPFSLWTTGETGGPMGVRAVGVTPGGTVAILMTQGGGGPTTIPGGRPCAGTLLDLNASMRPLRVLPADAQGRVQIGPMYVPTSVAPTTHLQAVDITTCKTSSHARIIF
jgi:hypothetical protein